MRLFLCLSLVLITPSAVGGTAGLISSYSQATGAPQLLKLEPPNWWVGHSLNPVRVMMRGRHLAGARVEASGPDIHIGLTRINAAGTYVFVDVLIDPQATPGPHRLKIITDTGTVTVPFELLAPLAPQGRFQGVSPDDVIYLLMPDRFANGDPTNDDPPASRGLWNRQKGRYYHGGDLQGIIDHLPYLKDLGVTAIWLTPITDNVNRLNKRETYNHQAITDYHGYGAVDFYAVEEHFGDMATFRQLVDVAHRLGLKVILDNVANHTGPYHPWVTQPPTPTWFNGTGASHLANTWQTWTLMDPHATPQMRQATFQGWFANILPDLNQNDEEVARYLIQNTLWWIGMTGLDGIREDTLPYVPRQFWHKWMAAIKREYPRFTVVGEVFDGNPALVSFFQGGRPGFDGVDSGIDTVFDFPLLFALRRAFARGKSIRQVAVTLGHDRLYVNPNLLVTFLGNHDLPRFVNEKGASIEGLKLAFSFILTARGIPQLYYGDEIAMPGGGDPDNRRDFPGGWPDDPRNAFSASGRTPEEQTVFEHVRRLTHMRAQLEPLRRGSMLDLAVSDQTYAYARVTHRDAVIVVLNNGHQETRVECSVAPAALPDGVTLEDRLGGAPDVQVEAGRISVRLAPRSASVYTLKGRPRTSG